MTDPLLKRITGPDGELLITRDQIEELRVIYSNPPELEHFIRKVYYKFITFYKNQTSDLGEIIQLLDKADENGNVYNKYVFENHSSDPSIESKPKQFVIPASRLTPDLNIRNYGNLEGENKKNFDLLENFTTDHAVFHCSFKSLGVPATPNKTHAFFIKKLGDGYLYVIDPHGVPIGMRGSAFTPEQAQQLRIIFDDYRFVDAECRFQGILGTCMLWSFLLLMYKKQTLEKLTEFINNIVVKLGYDFTDGAVADLIVIAIFEKFMKEDFATRQDVEKYPPGTYLEGLGKRCKKCGLPK
jgi:hypothetical protein